MPIELRDVSYVYNEGLPSEHRALSHINVTFREGEFCAIIGHTGSGKSTLIQLLNGLLKPTSGEVFLNGENIFEEPQTRSKKKRREARAKKMLAVRQKVGLVFQYPEHQLFEMTVAEDVAFGPRNMQLPQEEIKKRVKEAMAMVGLDKSYRKKSPFELSGGQKRRVAIAGVLAMKPDFLILDEPTAGLDPQGRDEILGQMKQLREEQGIAILLVSHSMDDVARYADRVVAIEEGELKYDGKPEEVFSHADELKAMGLGIPQVTELAEQLKAKGFPIEKTVLDLDEMEAILTEWNQAKTEAVSEDKTEARG
ncbi:MAG: energy-coupling factor transporter ATPase [Firmicutes bacterium]|nr:energy-coupling factor transporter ATPase [Bacillota bacterium]